MKSLGQKLGALALLLGSVVGCASESQTGEGVAATSEPAAAHAHSSTGPHGGGLVELGNETYHAEILHDDSQVTVYVLNGSADQQVAIEASEITINATSDGSPVQFALAATPDEGDPASRSSRFVGSDETLVKILDSEGSKAQLVLSIEGKSYRGAIADHHDHEGEGHDHDAHGNDDHEGHGHDEEHDH